MEEILASIRQIISEDGVVPSSAPPRSGDALADEGEHPQPPAADAVPGPAEMPDMTLMQEPTPPTIEVRSPVQERAPQFPHAPGRPAQDYAAARNRPAPAALARRLPAEENTLLSPEKGAAVSGAFSALAHTMLEQNSRTLEDVVTEMLQPMLRSWLDDNLPSLVERMVKEEIERVSRGRR
jgi:cell pole-organizing protein PopZ